jgi:hypothetical protein
LCSRSLPGQGEVGRLYQLRATAADEDAPLISGALFCGGLFWVIM